MKIALTPAEKAREQQMIEDPDRWPGPFLCVKSPPWKAERKFGIIHAGVPNTVYVRDSTVVIPYQSVDALLEEWIID